MLGSLRSMTTRYHRLVLLLVSLSGSIGCQHYGPRSIVADRIPYNEAIAASWKEQTLLNIVKLRYMDTPFFVDVPQITSGYTFQGMGAVNGGISPPVSNLASFAQQLGLTLNAQAAYQDRPTISYQPQTGSQFIRNLTQPINPGSVLFLLQSGYPADIVFGLTVESINGIRNRSVSGGQLRPADPEFNKIVNTLRKAQIGGHIGIRVERGKDKQDYVAMYFRDKDIDPDLAREFAEARKALRIDPSEREFKVVFGAAPSNPKELAILSRSVLRIMSELATQVEVPAQHIASGIALAQDETDAGGVTQFRVFSSVTKPCAAFTAVCYEGHWFWIDKTDFQSKRTIAHLLVLLALADSGTKESLPVITIQAN